MRAKKITKNGFTLIEVILFLAVSSAVLIAILAGTSSSLAQQRYNDSVQDLYSFLQSQYSAVINVQNSSGSGNTTDQAIYGKLIVFDPDLSTTNSIVNSYTIIGNDKPSTGSSTIDEAFNSLSLRIKCEEKNSYSSQWESTIETTATGNHELKRTIAILRSPLNGVVFTYRSKSENALVNANSCNENFLAGAPNFTTVFEQAKESSNRQVDLCVGNKDNIYGGNRRNIRISNTNSINSIHLIPLDAPGENKCQ